MSRRKASTFFVVVVLLFLLGLITIHFLPNSSKAIRANARIGKTLNKTTEAIAPVSKTTNTANRHYKTNATEHLLVNNLEKQSVILAKASLSNNSISYVPRLYLQGFAGSGILGQGDMLIPLLLSQTHNLFLYAKGRLSHATESWAYDSWSGNLGLGYRQLVNNRVMLGAFLLGDYNSTITNHRFWLLNPGVEALGRVWEFRANGYLPLGSKCWEKQGWASDYGDYSHIYFKGHDMYDALYVFHEEIGAGTDAEIGRVLFSVHNTIVKAYLGGYYFHMRHNHGVYGAGARITIDPTSYLQLSANDIYDKHQRNVFMVGIRVSVYDLFHSTGGATANRDLTHKLFVPIENSVATLGEGGSVPTTGSPADHGGNAPHVIPPIPGPTPGPGPKPGPGPSPLPPKYSDVWLFADSGVTANGATITRDGTYEHPFTSADFNQETLQKIENYHSGDRRPILFFSPGSVMASTPGYVPQPIKIYAGMTLQGRMGADKGFAEPALGDNRVLFTGAMLLASNVTLANLRVQNDQGVFESGLQLAAAHNVTLRNVAVGTELNDTGYHTGIIMENDSSLFLDAAKIYGYRAKTANDLENKAVGIAVKNGGTITADNNSAVNSYSEDGDGVALEILPNEAGNYVMGNINGDGTSVFTGNGGLDGYAVYAKAATAADISVGDISNVKFTGTSTKGNAYGIYLNTNKNVTLGTISAVTITATSSAANEVAGMDIAAANATIGDINGLTINANSDNSDVNIYGMYIQSIAAPYRVTMGNISGSNITAQGSAYVSNNNAYGFYATGMEVFNLQNISDSSFGASQAVGDDYGFFIQGDNHNGTVTINLGDITDNSNFEAFTGKNAYGMAIENGEISIGNIKNSRFNASAGEVGYGLNLTGDQITVANIDHSFFAGLGSYTNKSTSLLVNATGAVNIQNFIYNKFEVDSSRNVDFSGSDIEVDGVTLGDSPLLLPLTLNTLNNEYHNELHNICVDGNCYNP